MYKYIITIMVILTLSIATLAPNTAHARIFNRTMTNPTIQIPAAIQAEQARALKIQTENARIAAAKAVATQATIVNPPVIRSRSRFRGSRLRVKTNPTMQTQAAIQTPAAAIQAEQARAIKIQTENARIAAAKAVATQAVATQATVVNLPVIRSRSRFRGSRLRVQTNPTMQTQAAIQAEQARAIKIQTENARIAAAKAVATQAAIQTQATIQTPATASHWRSSAKSAAKSTAKPATKSITTKTAAASHWRNKAKSAAKSIAKPGTKSITTKTAAASHWRHMAK